MTIENFTTYTEVDPSNRLTVTASKAEGVDVDRDIDVYLYKDRGVAHFDALDIDFEVLIASSSLNTAQAGGIAVTNTIGAINDLVSTDFLTFFYRAGAEYRLYIWRGGLAQASDFYVCNADTLYYCTLERAAGNDAVSLKIYSDSGRTNLLDTLTIAGFGAVKWRYIYGFINYNDANSERDFDGYVQNLDLKEVVVVGRSLGYIIG